MGVRRLPKIEVGQVFDRLTAIGVAYVMGRGRKNERVTCRCDCGVVRDYRPEDLRSGRSRSCGCLRNEKIAIATIGNKNKRKAFGEAQSQALFYSYCRSAKRRDHAFKLSKDELLDIAGGDCHYCGVPPAQIRTTSHGYSFYIYNGIDRVDNAEGYEVGNCVPCCAVCNKMKLESDAEDFVDHIKRIYEHTVEGKERGDVPTSPEFDCGGTSAVFGMYCGGR